MSRTKKAEAQANQVNEQTDDQEVGGEGRSPDFLIRQYRTIRTDSGSKTRKETIGAIWQDAATGKQTIRFNGVQVISGDLHAYPNFDFKPPI